MVQRLIQLIRIAWIHHRL